MATDYPFTFLEDDYAYWHDNTFPQDCPIQEKVKSLISDIKVKSRDNLTYLASILYELAQHCEAECDIQTNYLTTGKFDIPIVKELKSGKEIPEKYFKPYLSIINKLWRKNKDFKERNVKAITLENIQQRISDLIRTSVIAPSFYHARELSNRLKNIKRLLRDPALRDSYDTIISSIEVDDEAKLASGYFAYHSLIHFQNGDVVEVQIYSQLTSSWRDLSHKIYEKSRIGDTLINDLGSPESRFVSLGHLLYMADCEFERLLKELKDKI